jgi:hypothetical protein
MDGSACRIVTLRDMAPCCKITKLIDGHPAGPWHHARDRRASPGQCEGVAMPLFLIERSFAEEVMLDDAGAAQIRQINDEIGIQWLYSFLSSDKRKTYCLYEAPNVEAIRTAAGRLNMPADVIIPVSEIRPEHYASGQPATV